MSKCKRRTRLVLLCNWQRNEGRGVEGVFIYGNSMTWHILWDGDVAGPF